MSILDNHVGGEQLRPMPGPTTDTRNASLYRAIGDLVSTQRLQVGLTQQELADRTGGRLSRSAIANIERGRQRVALHHLFDLADTLGVAPSTLLPDPTTLPVLPGQGAAELRERVIRPRSERLLDRSTK